MRGAHFNDCAYTFYTLFFAGVGRQSIPENVSLVQTARGYGLHPCDHDNQHNYRRANDPWSLQLLSV